MTRTRWSLRGLSLAFLLASGAPAEPAREMAMVAPRPDAAAPQGNSGVTLDPPPGSLMAGEALCLRTPSEPSLPVNGCYAIDLAGHADLPWVGRIHLEGRNPAQAEGLLAVRMGERLRGTPLRVQPAYKLGFVGAWSRPGEHYLAHDATLWDAMLAAGGPAGTNGTVQIMRGGELMLQVSLMGAYPKQAILKGVGIRSGDLFLLMPAAAPPGKSPWDIFKETLSVSAQLAAVMGSLLSAWLTYDVLKKGGAF